MRTHLLVLLISVAAFGIGLGFTSSSGRTEASGHGSHDLGGDVSLTIVSPGQLLCVASRDSIATFRVEENGGLKRVDIDEFVPFSRPDQFFLKEIYGTDD